MLIDVLEPLFIWLFDVIMPEKNFFISSLANINIRRSYEYVS